MRESVLERLTNVHPNLEIWWDSSPLVFQSWLQKMLDQAPAATQGCLGRATEPHLCNRRPGQQPGAGLHHEPASLFDRRKERPEVLE